MMTLPVCARIVEWLSFVPARRNLPVPITPSLDTWDREVIYTPPNKQPHDVRWLIGGKQDEDGFQPGLFDKDSFVETLGGWARTVVVGRARLGGIPMGVIAVETRTVENVTPADPANPDSVEQVSNEAGGVGTRTLHSRPPRPSTTSTTANSFLL